MEKPVQRRTIETRKRLLSEATAITAASGYEALRIDELAQRAKVAKGTFFAHFRDKDTLMDLLIGERIDQELDRIAAQPPPGDVESMAAALLPLIEFMATERYVFDVILRRSGAAAIEEIGPIATALGRLGGIVDSWLRQTGAAFRKDASVELLAEGVEAFTIQTVALKFCSLRNDEPLGGRFLAYLRVWLAPVA